MGQTESLDPVDFAALRDGQGGGDLGGRGDGGVEQDAGGRALAGGLQVVVEAAQFQGPFDLAVHDLGAHAAAAYEQALVDQGLDGLADGRAGQAEAGRQLDLVAQQTARGQLAVLDRGLQLLGQLEVERDRTAAVDAELERHGRSLFWFRHGPSVAPVQDDGKLRSSVVRTKH